MFTSNIVHIYKGNDQCLFFSHSVIEVWEISVRLSFRPTILPPCRVLLSLSMIQHCLSLKQTSTNTVNYRGRLTKGELNKFLPFYQLEWKLTLDTSVKFGMMDNYPDKQKVSPVYTKDWLIRMSTKESAVINHCTGITIFVIFLLYLFVFTIQLPYHLYLFYNHFVIYSLIW